MNDYLYKYLMVHVICAMIGLFATLINDREIRVKHVLLAFCFGVIYMIHEFSDLDALVIKLPEKKNK